MIGNVYNALSDLERLKEVVHDLWLESDGILLDDQNRLIFPMQEENLKNIRVENKKWVFKQKVIPIIRTQLIFHNVVKYDIVDTEKVGFYNISDIIVKNNEIGEYEFSIVTGIPIKITILSREFRVEYVRTDEILSWEKRWSLF